MNLWHVFSVCRFMKEGECIRYYAYSMCGSIIESMLRATEHLRRLMPKAFEGGGGTETKATMDHIMIHWSQMTETQRAMAHPRYIMSYGQPALLTKDLQSPINPN